MSIKVIKKLFETKLSQVTPSLPTGYEGVSFTPPQNQMYQLCQLDILAPDDPVYSANYHRERVQFQVFIIGPVNKGTGDVLTRAELIRQEYKKGTSLQEGNVLIRILTTPQIQSVAVAQDRLVCPVLIDAIVEVGVE